MTVQNMWPLAFLILIPVIISIVLGCKVISLNHKVQGLEKQIAEMSKAPVDEVTGVYTTAVVEESGREVLQTEDLIEASAVEAEQKETPEMRKKIYLTFDDGPSSNTSQILDILKKYDVKATFDAYSDRYYMDESHESLVMECKEILPTIKKSFKEKLMSLFTISNYVDKRVPLKVSFYGGNDCRENSTMSSLSDIIKGITDTEIERQLVTSERKLLLKKLNAIELKNAKREIREYL